MNGQSFKGGARARCALAAIALGAFAFIGVAPTAAATEGYAQQTGKSCTYCHTSADGGALSAAGDAFKANGDKLPKQDVAARILALAGAPAVTLR